MQKWDLQGVVLREQAELYEQTERPRCFGEIPPSVDCPLPSDTCVAHHTADDLKDDNPWESDFTDQDNEVKVAWRYANVYRLNNIHQGAEVFKALKKRHAGKKANRYLVSCLQYKAYGKKTTSSSSKLSVRFHETVASKSYCPSEEPSKTGDMEICKVQLDDAKNRHIWHRAIFPMYREERTERHIRTQIEEAYWKKAPRDHDSFPECSGIVPKSIPSIPKRSKRPSGSEEGKEREQ